MKRIAAVVLMRAVLVGGCGFLTACTQTEDGVSWETHIDF